MCRLFELFAKLLLNGVGIVSFVVAVLTSNSCCLLPCYSLFIYDHIIINTVAEHPPAKVDVSVVAPVKRKQCHSAADDPPAVGETRMVLARPAGAEVKQGQGSIEVNQDRGSREVNQDPGSIEANQHLGSIEVNQDPGNIEVNQDQGGI